MSNRWPGGIIRKTPVTPTGPLQTGAASGVWSLADAAYWTKQGLWPTAGRADGTFAIIALGQNTARNKYTYSGDVVSTGGAATNNSLYGSAAGNTTVGIFAIGRCQNCCVTTALRNKYTYSGDVVSAGGAATTLSRSGSAASNGIAGITL
jgi:hypothetical protein